VLLAPLALRANATTRQRDDTTLFSALSRGRAGVMSRSPPEASA
jgi:hypothetical protein